MGHFFFVTNIFESVMPGYTRDQLHSMHSLTASELTSRTENLNDGYVTIIIMNVRDQVPTLRDSSSSLLIMQIDVV